ncbi:MAG: hypothetical protein Cons2KO_29160 [Congregibacter sp.]
MQKETTNTQAGGLMTWSKLSYQRWAMTALVVCVPIAWVQPGVADEVSAAPLASRAIDEQQPVSRFAFGSCFKASRGGHEIWGAIQATNPAFFVFAGDTLYPEKDDTSAALPELKAAYAALAKLDSFARFRMVTPVYPIWDDHDFGRNDGGGDYPFRRESEALFESQWGLADDDPRVAREGLYFSRVFGGEGKRLQLIVLDTRSFRSPLRPSPDRGKPGRERYVPDDTPDKTMLGATQWDWLAETLRKPADFRVLVSSVQVLADGHGWEGWRQLPKERERLLGLLGAVDDAPLLLLSGDRHIAGFYEQPTEDGATLLEFTSSALNNPIGFPFRRFALAEAGPRRLGEPYGEANFGSIAIDWDAQSYVLELHDAKGQIVKQLQRRFKAGQPEHVAHNEHHAQK